MDVLTNNRIQVANCNISGLTTCIGNTNTCVGNVLTCVQGTNTSLSNTNTCVGNVLGCVQSANSNIGGLQTCIQNTNTCNSNQQTCLSNIWTCANSLCACIAGKSTGTLGYELIAGCSGNYGCMCVARPGKFQHYVIMGSACCWTHFCSHMTIGFYGACSQGCSANNAGSWCCNQCSCGIIYNSKCNHGSYQYGCAGNMAWIFGCTGGCYTACSGCNFTWVMEVMPNAICAYDRAFRYHMKRSQGGGNYMCCTGIENSGHSQNCCGADPTCMQYICFSNPSAVCSLGCANISIFGVHRLAC